jgi:PAS domain S-box-containing protein
MQTDKTAGATDNLSGEQRVRFLEKTFRSIHLVVFLIFVFAVVQMFALWQVCNTGMRTAASLEHQGLPALNELASLQENLALYRLESYEYLFAQEGEKVGEAKVADGIALQMRAELKNIQTLFPEGEGPKLASNLENAVDDLDTQFQKVRKLVNSDFAAAMKSMDQDIPPRTRRVDAAADALKKFGYQFSGGQASATFASFGWIKTTAVMFGAANSFVVFCAIVFVLLAARRSRAQLSHTMARLDERTGELAYERDLLRSLLDYSPDQIYFKDVQSRFIKSSKAQAENFRVKDAAELIGKTDFDFFTDEHARPAFEDEQEILRTGRPMIGKMEKEVWKDGRETWALASKMPLRNKDGQIIGTFGISKDITALKQVEADLAHERNLLRTMIDNLPEAIYIKDLSGRKTLANRAELKNMGCKTEAEAIGKSDFDIYPKELAASYFAVDQTVIQTGQALINRENKIVTPAGETHWVLSSKIPLRDASGAIIGIVGMNHDITIIKEAETKLRQAHKELLETSRQAGMAEIATNVLHNVGNVLNSVNVSASLVVDNVKKSKASSLAKVVTMFQEHEHDLGTFITSDAKGKQLPAYLAQLSEQLLADQMTTVNELALLLKNIEHIKEIVTMQQTYARVSGVKEVINLRELVEDSLRMNLGALDRHGVEVVREFEDVPLINIDKHKVLQVLVNLIRNAKHACQDSERADKRLTVRLTNGDGRAKIIVMDNGVGISPENLLRIFNHGFTTRKDGHGFGLHSGALAAKEMGGSLSVASDGADRGATFTLELPVQPD